MEARGRLSAARPDLRGGERSLCWELTRVWMADLRLIHPERGVKIWGGGEALTVGVPWAAPITTGYISAIPSCSPAHSLKHTSLAFSVFC